MSTRTMHESQFDFWNPIIKTDELVDEQTDDLDDNYENNN